MLNKEILKILSKKTNIKNKAFLEKAYYQDLLLYDLTRTNLEIIFKGGTALYKFYGLPRFSEDLDFAIKNIELVPDKIKKYLKDTK